MEVGLTDHEITFIQAALNLVQKGDLKVDGIDGDATTSAVRKFELAHRETPTGVVSKEMITALLKDLADWNKNRKWVHRDDKP